MYLIKQFKSLSVLQLYRKLLKTSAQLKYALYRKFCCDLVKRKFREHLLETNKDNIKKYRLEGEFCLEFITLAVKENNTKGLCFIDDFVYGRVGDYRCYIDLIKESNRFRIKEDLGIVKQRRRFRNIGLLESNFVDYRLYKTLIIDSNNKIGPVEPEINFQRNLHKKNSLPKTIIKTTFLAEGIRTKGRRTTPEDGYEMYTRYLDYKKMHESIKVYDKYVDICKYEYMFCYYLNVHCEDENPKEKDTNDLRVMLNDSYEFYKSSLNIFESIIHYRKGKRNEWKAKIEKEKEFDSDESLEACISYWGNNSYK